VFYLSIMQLRDDRHCPISWFCEGLFFYAAYETVI
jgi:hypothetical protein